MSNYSSKYIHDYATITAPLRELTKKNARFSWEQEHQRAFDKLKQALVSAPVMGYFDTKNDTMLTVDASPVGVSAILAQSARDQSDYKVIAYASRSLSNVEQRYSQTEKDCCKQTQASTSNNEGKRKQTSKHKQNKTQAKASKHKQNKGKSKQTQANTKKKASKREK